MVRIYDEVFHPRERAGPLLPTDANERKTRRRKSKAIPPLSLSSVYYTFPSVLSYSPPPLTN